MILKTSLFKHQKEACDKLLRLKVGALYMEQGTGKTRTVLEMIKRRLDMGRIEKVLWLCPCSVRSDLRLNLSFHSEGWEKHIKIIGIESLSSSFRLIKESLEYVDEKTFLVIDESNLVKNHKAYRTERINDLAEQCTYKVILNGTPVSKNEADLFSQWQLLDWRILGYKSFYSFANKHVVFDPDNPAKIAKIINKEQLLKKITPYVYQTRKDECLDLPPKMYHKVQVKMSDEQAEEYRRVGRVLLTEQEEIRSETIYRLFTGLQNVLSGKSVTCGVHLSSAPLFDNPRDNPRIIRLLELLNEINGKVIVYCKYTSEIEDLYRVVPSSVPFYGKMSFEERRKAIESFRNDKRVMIANKACAGYGLNLQFANNIVYFSNDWDYATRSQSEDRIHRIGQDKEVHIYDMIVPHTIDQRICNCLGRKEDLVLYFRTHIDEIKNELSIQEGLNAKQEMISKEVLKENGDA